MLVLPEWLKQYSPAIVLFLAVLLLSPSYWVALNTPATGIYHDDSLYLITAKALAEGRGYTIESTPASMAQTKYPVLFPALLAMVWKLSPGFPANLLYFKLIPLLATLAWLTFSFLILRQQSSNSLFAATAVALTAASPQVVFLSTTVLSETVFAALSSACIYLLLRDRVALPPIFGAAILAAAAYHTRTIGFCLVIAVMASLAWQRRMRQLACFTLTAGCLAAPWLVWQALNRSAADPYLSQENYYSSYNVVVNFELLEKVRIVLTNLLFLPFSARPIFDLVWGGALGLLATPFLVRALWRKELALPIRGFLGFSLLVMLLWVWPPLRFLIPILPLLLLGVWLGSPAKLRPFWTLSFVLLSLWSATASHSYAKWAETSGFYCPVPTGQEEWQSFQQQMDWVRANTPTNAVLQANVDPTLFLFTGRHAIRGSHGNASLTWYLDRSDALGSPEQFHKTLVRNGVTHVVDTPWTWFLETKLLTALIEADRKTHPQSWTLLHKAANPNYKIYRFSGEAVGASTR